MFRKIQSLSKRNYFWIFTLILAAGWSAWLVWELHEEDSLVSSIENQSIDWRIKNGQAAPLDPRILFIGFESSAAEILFPEDIEGNPALEMMTERWPWNREIWALVAQKLLDAGARVVGIDIVFEGANPKQDAPLRAVIDKNRDRIVLGIREETALSQGRHSANLVPLSESLVPDWDSELFTPEGRLGLVNIVPDADQVVRNYIYKGRGLHLPEVDAFATKMLRKAGKHRLADSTPLQAMPHYGPPPPGNYPPIMLWDLFLEDTWKSTFQNGAYFKDKLILIGPYGTGFKDVHPTPIAKNPPLAGPQIHLNALAAALNQNFIYPSSPRSHLLWLTGSLLIPFCLFFIPGNRSWCYLFWAIGCIGILGYAYIVYQYKVILSPLIYPLLGWSGIWFLLISSETIRSWLEKRKIRTTLDRYLSKEVASTLILGSEQYYQALGGVRREAVVLFSDLRNFTTLSEKEDPGKLVVLLNEYLTEMVEAIFAQGGRLDKFMGDAVMAVWGDLYSHRSQEENCIDAVRAAIDMQARLEELNKRWSKEGRTNLTMGIGLHAGALIFGNLGSEQRMELTVIGDTVNLSSRLEGLTKTYQMPILVSDTIARATAHHFSWQLVDKVQVKGREQPVDIFTLDTYSSY